MHGSAHLTNDLDLCCSRRSANLRRPARELAPYHPRPAGFPLELPFVWDDRTLHSGTVFTLDTDPGSNRPSGGSCRTGRMGWKNCVRLPALDRAQIWIKPAQTLGL